MKLCVFIHWTNGKEWRSLRIHEIWINRLRTSHHLVTNHEIPSTFRSHHCMPAGRFFFFNITGGVCWAWLFGFGAHAAGAEIYKISGTEVRERLAALLGID